MKILHAADFHLDAPFAALPPSKGAQRRAEGRELLGRMAQLVREEGVDLVLLAGDLFDGETVYRETLTALSQALAAMEVPVLIAPGNHDPFTPHSPYATLSWPENVTIFTKETVDSKSFPELGCVVHGVGFTRARVDNDLWEGFSAPRDGLLHIGVAHADVCQSSSLYAPMSQSTLEGTHLNYLALGHIHTPSGLQRAGGTAWAYPGCPEGRGFDELGERGCLLVHLEQDGVAAEFRPLAQRLYLEVPVDVSEFPPLEAAERALILQSPRNCVKLILTGPCDQAPDLELLHRKLNDRVYALRLVDRTRPKLDRDRQAQEDTLTGAFLRAMARHPAAGSPQADLALRFGLAALERGEDCRP